MDRPAIVVTGGDPVDAHLAEALPRNAFVVAADSGLEHSAALGLEVDVVIGDMDSVSPSLLEEAAAAGTVIDRHPQDKDATDLELALRYVADAGYTKVIVLGGKGGDRLDHFLGNALALASDDFEQLDVEWHPGHPVVEVVRESSPVHGGPGDIVSLLPLGGTADGVTTSGLRWPLDGDALQPGTTRGISNQLVDETATVTVERGVLLVIHQEQQP